MRRSRAKASCLLGALVLLARSGLSAGRTVILGDSMFAGGSSVKGRLEAMSGVSMEMYAVVGASYHEGDVTSIPGEYYGMSRSPAPDTIIMDGGGNDAMSNAGDCLAFNDHCRQVIDEAGGILAGMLAKFHEDGVKHVIYLGYYHARGMDAAVDYGVEKYRTMCETGPVDCHFVDVRESGVPVGGDGMHPTDEGYGILAQRIMDVKNQHNIPFV